MTSTLHNPYKVLGVTPLASTEEIKTAYRKLAMQYHPDRNPDDKHAEQRFKEVTEAYASLRNAKSKRSFNQQNNSTKNDPYINVDWQDIFKEVGITINQKNSTHSSHYLGDVIFNALLKGVNNLAKDFMHKQGLIAGEDYFAVLDINLDEARYGVVKRLNLPKSKKRIDVSIPADVHNGQKLRLEGQGGAGNPPGDFYVTLNLRLPKGVSFSDRDLHAELTITPLEAKYGLKSKLLGLKVDLPPNLQDGQKIRVSGGGIASGDLLITIKVRVWQGLWRKVKDWFAN